MIRWLAFLALAACLTGYAMWVYSRAELPVRGSRTFAVMRSAALVLVLLLLFDPRLPGGVSVGDSGRWVLLDASLSMTSGDAWSGAVQRAVELSGDGWRVLSFGSASGLQPADLEASPDRLHTLLAPALERAAEAGAREIRVLSDLRFEDGVAVRAALEALPLAVEFEAFGVAEPNAGVASLDVSDAPRPEGTVTARLEVHAAGVDSLVVEVLAEGVVIARTGVTPPAPGLRATVRLEVPVPGEAGRVRYTARVIAPGDSFEGDDEAVSYATVGHPEGALVFVSLRADWEPRYLLPVLADVTGLPAVGYLRVGPDRFVPLGRTLERTHDADSATVRKAVDDAALVVLHGFQGDGGAWDRALLQRAGRVIVLPGDPEGASMAGVDVGAARTGEWYASGDVPASPVAGEFSGAMFQGLPPVGNVFVPSRVPNLATPLLLQLRGAGEPEAALLLDEREGGRRVVALASGFWRWAARDGQGYDAYRRMWAGLAGWILASDVVSAAEARPSRWVFEREDPIVWNLPTDSVPVRLTVFADDSTMVADTTMAGPGASIGALGPGSYRYEARTDGVGDVVSGRFDVQATTTEMLPVRSLPEVSPATGRAADARRTGGSPLRTSPWPYLLIMLLLCAEWVLRRRAGLR